MKPDLEKHVDYISKKIIGLAKSKKGHYIPAEEVLFHHWQRIMQNLRYVENGQQESYLVEEVSFLVKFVREQSRQLLDVNWGRILKVLEMEMTFNDLSLANNQSYVAPHNRNVAAYAAAVARAASQVSLINKDEIDHVFLAASLHDIGKLAISNDILQKPAKLSPKEIEEIKKHPTLGREIIRSIDEIFKTSIDPKIPPAVESHHEKFFGGGYPLNLRGDEIPVHARIIAICDSFDAMTSERPYQPKRNLLQTLQEIRENARGQFDPELVQIAIEPLSQAFNTTRRYLNA